MKRILKYFFLFFLLPIHVLASPETYKFDNQHTYVLWHVSHFDFSHPSGKWMVEGTLVFDEAKPQNDKVNVTIHVADLITGIKELDEHLKGKLFFDVAQFPTATFVSDTVNKTGKTTATVRGVLTLHGVSKPITLDVNLNKIGVSSISNKKTLGFTAHTTLKRSDFGITTLIPGVSDEVKIDIEGEAYI